MLLLGNFPRMVRSAGWWHRTVIRLIRWSDGGKARRTRVVLILVVAELWLTFGFIAVGGDPQLSKLTGLEWVLEYVKAAAQTFETLLERGKAGPAALQQLVTSHWNVAMVASRAGNDDEMQRALGRAYQLLRAMKENDIPLNSNCEQILAQLEQMLSNNQSQ